MDILFVGSEIKGNYAAEVAFVRKENINFLQNANLFNIVNDIINAEPENLIINLEQLNNSETEIVSAIRKIRNSYICRIIIMACGYNRNMTIIDSLFNIGIHNYILSNSLGEMKTELHDCLDGKYDTDPTLLISGKNTDDEVKGVTIGVSGIVDRIGTTTFCIQTAQYLKSKGFKVCYIEINEKHYVEDILYVFEGNVEYSNPMLGFIRYEGLDMYYKPEHIEKILEFQYDYYIYDYGNICSPNFGAVSFIEKGINIVMCGSKANEIINIQDAMDLLGPHTIPWYLYNFSAENERNEIKHIMGDKAYSTLFMEYTPDAFTLSSDNFHMYSLIFPEKQEMEKEQQKKDIETKNKKRFFGKRKK